MPFAFHRGASAKSAIRAGPAIAWASSPHALIAAGLVAVLALVFMLAFRFSEPVARLLVLLAGAACVVLLLVPSRKSSTLLMIAMGLSIPFAHFAMIVVVGEGVQYAHLFGALLIVHLVVRTLLGRPIPLTPALPWVGGLVIASFVSALAFIDQPAEHVVEFWKSEVQLLFCVLLFLAVTQLRPRSRHVLWMLKAMLVISCGIALYGVYQLPARYYGLPGGIIEYTNPSLSSRFQSIELIRNLARAASVFSEPSFFGRYVAGMLAMSLAAALHRPRLFGSHIWLWVVIAIQAMGLVVSFSMGSYYLMIELAIVMLVVESGRVRGKLIGWLLMLLLVGSGAMLTVEAATGFQVRQYFSERVYGIVRFVQGDESYMVEGESVFQRVSTSRVALRVWRDHPVIGVGVGSYTLVSYRYGEWNPFGWSANTLVNTLAEMGLIGFVMLLFLSLAALYGLWRVFKRGPPIAKPGETSVVSNAAESDSLLLAARMVFYLLVIEVLYFHLANSLYQPGVWFYLGLAGMIVALSRRKEGETS